MMELRLEPRTPIPSSQYLSPGLVNEGEMG
jgi:hypothetical protein